jgi:hypothetical protein
MRPELGFESPVHYHDTRLEGALSKDTCTVYDQVAWLCNLVVEHSCLLTLFLHRLLISLTPLVMI